MRRLVAIAGLALWLITPGLSQTAPAVQPDSLSPTWQAPPPQPPGSLGSARFRALPGSAFAFSRVRKEPLTDAAHVRSALARFSRVLGVTDEERDVAFANIKKAAEYYGVHLRVKDWRQLGRGPGRKQSAAQGTQ
jgi:hypothetical protein